MTESIQPFDVSFDESQFDDLRQRLSQRRLPEQETVSDWSQGVPLAYVEELADYWLKRYDHTRLTTRLGAFSHFKTRIDELNIHFTHIQSKEACARPLLLLHGWPGSVLEFLNVIPMLVNPVSYGGNKEDAFHVVCPSLPGYGFSEKPKAQGVGVPQMANIFGTLMQRLNYKNYFAQGGDWGSAIASYLALNDDNCAAIHLNMVPVGMPKSFKSKQNTVEPASTKLSQEEQASLKSMRNFKNLDSAYHSLQRTRPQTIGYALLDSPLALLAWIVDKFWSWTDCERQCKRHPENAISRDEMLDGVTLYWLTATGASSARLYWENFGHDPVPTISKPVGVSVFPKEIVGIPRHWAEQTYENIVYWNQLEKGGHFAALEQPDLFARELRACFRLLPNESIGTKMQPNNALYPSNQAEH